MRKPLVTAVLLALIALIACSGRTGTGSMGGNPSSPSPSSPGRASPSSSTTAKPITAPKGWKIFSYRTIAFAYPVPPGSVEEVSDGEDGPRHGWMVERSDRCDPRGTCRSYEFAAVNDGCPVAEGWPTFAHRWLAGSPDHLSTCAGKETIDVEPIRVVERPDGLRGIVYDANEWFSKDQKIAGALAAVLNFPKGFHRNYEAIAFYFEDPTPLETIEQVLRLVTLG